MRLERRLGGGREVVFWVDQGGDIVTEHLPHVHVPRYLSEVDAGLMGRQAPALPRVMPVAEPTDVEEEFHFGLGEVWSEEHGNWTRLRQGVESRKDYGTPLHLRYGKIRAAHLAGKVKRETRIATAALELGIERLPSGRLPTGARQRVLAWLKAKKAGLPGSEYGDATNSTEAPLDDDTPRV